MPHGVHAKSQTAFRLPEGLLAWLKEQAGREGGDVTMTAIVERALKYERERCEGITTSAAPSVPVSPPRERARKSRADTAPPAAFRPPQPQRCTHQGTRVIGGYCKHCDHMIEPGGLWRVAR